VSVPQVYVVHSNLQTGPSKTGVTINNVELSTLDEWTTSLGQTTFAANIVSCIATNLAKPGLYICYGL